MLGSSSNLDHRFRTAFLCRRTQAFWLKVLVRRDKFENRRKFHKYTYTYEHIIRIARLLSFFLLRYYSAPVQRFWGAWCTTCFSYHTHCVCCSWGSSSSTTEFLELVLWPGTGFLATTTAKIFQAICPKKCNLSRKMVWGANGVGREKKQHQHPTTSCMTAASCNTQDNTLIPRTKFSC